MRVTKSPMGSVKVMGLPGRFFNTRNVAIDGEFAEANTTDAEETHIATLTMTQLAAVVCTDLVLWLLALRESLLHGCILVLPAFDDCGSGHGESQNWERSIAIG